MLDLLLSAVLLGAAAVVWAVVLVDTGMLLEPLQRWLRKRHKAWWVNRIGEGETDPEQIRQLEEAYHMSTRTFELDYRWWFKALWGCFWCVAGQLGFWVYLLTKIHWHEEGLDLWAYHPLHHAYFVSLAILSAGVWNRLYQWSRQY